MTRMHAIANLLGAGLGLALAMPASAQTNVRIGFVNVNAVLQMAPQTQELNETLNAEFAPREAALVARDEELKGKVERLNRDGAVMPQSERATLEREITTGQRDLERDAAVLQEDAQLRQNELLNELQTTIATRIRAFAVAEGYDLVVTNQGVVFASEAIDITEAVLRALSSGTAAGASTEAAPSTPEQ